MVQYAERVWGVSSSLSKDEKIDIAINKTIEFFEKVGNPTKLSTYNFGSENFDKVIASLKANGMTTLGEHGDISLDDVNKILEMSL
jgi:NADP-dependent alcohol dehydrogenase